MCVEFPLNRLPYRKTDKVRNCWAPRFLWDVLDVFSISTAYAERSMTLEMKSKDTGCYGKSEVFLFLNLRFPKSSHRRMSFYLFTNILPSKERYSWLLWSSTDSHYHGKILITSRDYEVCNYASSPRPPVKLRFFTNLLYPIYVACLNK